MTYYGKFTPYLQLSTLPDRSDNTLPLLGSEEFTATKSIEDLGLSITTDTTTTAGHAYIAYDLSSWTSTNYVVLYNHEDSDQSLYLVFITDPGDVTTDEFFLVPPGSFAVVPGILPATSTLFGVTGSLVVYTYDASTTGDVSTFDLYVAGS